MSNEYSYFNVPIIFLGACMHYHWSNTLFCHTDVGLRLRQQPNHTAYNIRDHSIVRLAALGTLLCVTPYQNCCQNRGQWRYPNGSIVPASQDGTLLFTSRFDQGVLGLQGSTNFSHESVDGVYECQIPDEDGRTQSLSAWIYSGPPCKLLALYMYTSFKRASCFKLITKNKI